MMTMRIPMEIMIKEGCKPYITYRNAFLVVARLTLVDLDLDPLILHNRLRLLILIFMIPIAQTIFSVTIHQPRILVMELC